MLTFILIFLSAIYNFCVNIIFPLLGNFSIVKLLKIIHLRKIDFFQMCVHLAYSLFFMEYFFSIFTLNSSFLENNSHHAEVYTFGKGNSFFKCFLYHYKKEGSDFDNLGKFQIKDNINIRNSSVQFNFIENNNLKFESKTELIRNKDEHFSNGIKPFSNSIKKDKQFLAYLTTLTKNIPYDYSNINLDENLVKDHLYYLPDEIVKQYFSQFENIDRLNYCDSMLIGKYQHLWVVYYDSIYDNWYRSNGTSWGNIPSCEKGDSGCLDILLFKQPVMEGNQFEKSGKKYNQYITNPILVQNEEELNLLKELCTENRLLKNHPKSEFFAYDKYVNNLKNNNYLYQTSDTLWCNKGKELSCKMNQQFLASFNQVKK